MLVTFDLDRNVTRSSFCVKLLILLKPPGRNIFVVTAHDSLSPKTLQHVSLLFAWVKAQK